MQWKGIHSTRGVVRGSTRGAVAQDFLEVYSFGLWEKSTSRINFLEVAPQDFQNPNDAPAFYQYTKYLILGSIIVSHFQCTCSIKKGEIDNQ